jgi:Zn-dependent protease
MHTAALLDGLMGYAFLVAIVTVHEFGHAWMAWKCGDDTARSLGRVTLNPIAHMDLIGTVILPLLIVVLAASGSSNLARFIIGWGKPVPVNPSNFQHPIRDDIAVAMAGPAMNVLLAFLAAGVAKAALLAGATVVVDPALRLALLSMFLCFFNLLPIPPLDGSHLMKYLVRMSPKTFFNISRFGFFIVIAVMQVPQVRDFIQKTSWKSVALLMAVFGIR